MPTFQLILQTRLGLTWETFPYLNLIEALCEKEWDERDLTQLSEEDIAELLKAVYAKWGFGRINYYKSVQNVFRDHHVHINEDCRLFRSNLEVIPPDLKFLKCFVEKLLDTMNSRKFKKETENYKTIENYMPEINKRKEIAAAMKVDMPLEKVQRKLYKLLQYKRKDMIEMLKNSIKDNEYQSRSRRETSQVKLQKRSRLIEARIISGQEEGFTKKWIEPKGWGVFATRQFEAKEFLLEYSGKLITYEQGKDAHKEYSKDPTIGSFIFDFNFGKTKYSIDATVDTGKLGRLVNHSFKQYNAKPKMIYAAGQPRIILIATKTIKVGEEILYDYGERSATAIEYHPWLRQ